MKDDPTSLHDEATLQAFVDGRLDAHERAAFQARLQVDEEAAARVQALQRQRESLRELHREVLQEPVPAAMLHTAQLLRRRSDSFADWQRWGGWAASLFIAFTVGWASNQQWQIYGERAAAAKARGAGEFARQAGLAHAVYLPEVRHPVEVDATQQEHLVQWLSRRLNRALKIPNLGEQGYQLVGGRLLPGEKGARAQFMYQAASGDRITLYVGAIDDVAGRGNGPTAFRFTADGQVATFYWADQGFGYALAGKLPRQRLLALAESVYRQL